MNWLHTQTDAHFPPPVPPELEWKAARGEAEAHAFSTSAGWMRCACRAKVWNVLLVPGDELPRNEECAAIAAGRVPESELAAMAGY